MNEDKQQEPVIGTAVPVECPKCHHKFFHNIKDALKDAAEGLGNAIGEAKFGGE